MKATEWKAGAAMSIICLLGVLQAGTPIAAQTRAKTSEAFPLLQFDEAPGMCRAKGRLQDDYCISKMMDQIVARGKIAVPILISQLTDARPARPILDFWNHMTVGDIAYVILDDLFTDSDWKTLTMPGLKAWDDLWRDTCKDSAETCWHRYVKAHGRRFVQRQWRAAWNANKDRIYWDANARCFRVSKNVKPATGPRTP